MIDPIEKAKEAYPPSQVVGDYEGDRYVDDEWGYDEAQRTAFLAGAKFEREQIIEFIQRLKKVEQESLPAITLPMSKAMSGYAVGEFEGILHVLEKRNAE
jgi:hypothetical protein